MADNIKSTPLLTISKSEPNKKGEATTVRVVMWSWLRDGKVGTSVKLEKRKLYKDENGEDKNGKAEGFTMTDLDLILSRAKEIQTAMANPPAPPAFEPQAADSEPAF